MNAPETDTDPAVPRGLVVASEVAWRSMVVGAALALLIWGAAYLSFVVAPIVVAIFVTAMLEPVRRRFISWGLTEIRASIAAFFLGLILILGVVGAAVSQFYANFDEITNQATEGVDKLSSWLENGPLKIQSGGLANGLTNGIDRLKEHPAEVFAGAFSVLSTTGGLVAGGLLALITTLFLLTDRRRIANGLLAAVPSRARPKAAEALVASWSVLVAYVRVTLTEATICSVVIGTACAIARLPISFALAVIVFLFGFIPTLGAIVSGSMVVIAALVTQGPTTAIVLAVVVLVVQQLDANVLYPYLTSRRLSLHPLGSLLLVASGGIIGGIFGAFIAVPIAAMLIAAKGALFGTAEPVPG